MFKAVLGGRGECEHGEVTDEPRRQQFDRWLRSVRVQLGHVEVVQEDDHSLPNRGTYATIQDYTIR